MSAVGSDIEKSRQKMLILSPSFSCSKLKSTKYLFSKIVGLYECVTLLSTFYIWHFSFKDQVFNSRTRYKGKNYTKRFRKREDNSMPVRNLSSL